MLFTLKNYLNLSLSKKIYIATALGLIIGMFFGDICLGLEPINKTFIKLFQITIIPYMVFSILESIGSLNYSTAKVIGKRGGIILIALWGLSIFYALCLHPSLPDIERARFFSPPDAKINSSFDLFDLFIPSNPFNSLANGYIPAIVIFSVLVGISIIRQQKRSALIESSKILASLMKDVNSIITHLLPVGVLVMSSYTFGTINLANFKSVLAYISASLIYIIFMSLLILPGIASSMVNLPYRRFLHYSMPAALIAFTTGSVFLSLPVIYELMNKYEQREREKGFCLPQDYNTDKSHKIVNIIIPLAWVVPATYKFLVVFFIVFAHWYYGGSSLGILREFIMYISSIPCLFGSNAAIVPFLLEISNLPTQAYNIFMLVSSFMVYFNNANAAIFIVVFTVLCHASMTGELKISWSKVARILVLGTFLFVGIIYSLNVMMGRMISGNEAAREELTHMKLHPHNKDFYSSVDLNYFTIDEYKDEPFLDENEPLLDKICRTKVLKVGYNPEAPPFSFYNHNDELVGYDIDAVYDMAEELNCERIDFYAMDNITQYMEALDSERMVDIYIGGQKYRGPVVDNIRTSDPYMKEHMAIVIPYADKRKYPDFYSIFRDRKVSLGILAGAKIGASKEAVNISKSRDIIELGSYSDYYKKHKTYAFLTTAEVAFALNISNPGHWIINYKGEDLDFHFAYVLPSMIKADTFRDFVNSYIKTAFATGKAEERYNYWIMGQAEIQKSPRWSLLGVIQDKEYFTDPQGADNITQDWKNWIGDTAK